MIREKTTFILGAGASYPYGLPLGSELIRAIARNLRQDKATLQAIQDFGFDVRALPSLAGEIEGSAQPSIDRFLEVRAESDLTQLGKVAIACALIPSEQPGNATSRDRESHWYQYLFQNLEFDKQGVHSPISIITFNYDRSLEFYLSHAFKNSLGISTEQAQQLLETIPICHVYGLLGGFSTSGGPGSRPYSPDLSGIQVAVENLRIMHEGDMDNPTLRVVETEIARSERICFLGFGYHQVNLERLSLGCYPGTTILGSTYMLGRDEIRRARLALGDLAGGPTNDFSDKSGFVNGKVTLGSQDEDCLAFLRNHPVFD